MNKELKVIENEKELTSFEKKPSQIVKLALEAAKELQKIVDSRDKKLIVGGKQYLFFEDWQTLGRFDRTTAKVIKTEGIYQDSQLIGFCASAVALKDGIEISAADAECCFDEENWKNKPRFQLRSMAQTRACSKALRNCLAFIAVLAKYEPTPAEEMIPEKKNTDFATQPQVELIKKQIVDSHLFDPKKYVKDKSIISLLEGGMTKTKASEIISWWKGDSKKFITGERTKREAKEQAKPDLKATKADRSEVAKDIVNKKIEVKNEEALFPDEETIAAEDMPD